MNKFLKMKAAASLENMSKQMGHGGAAGPADNMASTMGAGMGMGMGFMMPSMFAGLFKDTAGPDALETVSCLSGLQKSDLCRCEILPCLRASPHDRAAVRRVRGKPPAHGQILPRCGAPAEMKLAIRKCPHCGTEALKESVFCNHCGEKL